MEYHSGLPSLEAEQALEETTSALRASGVWVQLGRDAMIDHIVELERYTLLPTVRDTQMVDSFRQASFIFSIVNWRTRWQAPSQHHPAEFDHFSLHAMLHIRPTADAGHLMLRPETLGDKVNELFRRTEIDFPGDRVFCRRHFVLANDSASAGRLLTEDVRQCLNAVPHAALESRGGGTVLAPLAVATPELVGPLLRAGQALAATA